MSDKDFKLFDEIDEILYNLYSTTAASVQGRWGSGLRDGLVTNDEFLLLDMYLRRL